MGWIAEGETRRWIFAAASALCGGGLVLVLFRAPKISTTHGSVAPPPPVMVRSDDGTDAAFDEKRVLADPTPLFLPTQWNATRRGITRPEPGATFENYPPIFSPAASETGLKPILPAPVGVPVTPTDALLADRPGPLLLGFGRTDAGLPVLAERGAFVEIVAEGTGQAVLRQALTDARPPGDGGWQPMKFLVAVNATGLVGTLAVTQRSGVAAVDEYFQRYLAQTLRVGQRLAPGFYRISVGP
jgi:hypothetical protein